MAKRVKQHSSTVLSARKANLSVLLDVQLEFRAFAMFVFTDKNIIWC